VPGLEFNFFDSVNPMNLDASIEKPTGKGVIGSNGRRLSRKGSSALK